MEEYSEKSLFVVAEDQRNFAAYFSQISENGQIGFVKDKGDDTGQYYPTYLYAKDCKYGDGAWSDKTVLNNDIMIDGGPLASTAVINKLKKKYSSNDNGIVSVSSGTNIQQLLSYLFTATKYPTHTETNKSRNPSFSIDAPTITVKNGSTSVTTNAVIEYKTVLTLSKITPSSNYKFNGTTREVTNMIYGFTYGGTDGKNTPGVGTSYSLSWRNATNSSDNINYSVNIVEKKGCFGNVSVNTNDGCINANTSLSVAIGDNKLEIDTRATNTSGNFKAAINAIPNIKLKANDGSQPDKDENDTPKTGFISGVAAVTNYYNKNIIDSSNTSLSFTGVYACFTNKDTNSNKDTTSIKCGLTAGKEFTIEFNPESTSNFAMFAYPASKTLTVEIYNPMLNSGSFEKYNGVSTSESFEYNGIAYKRWKRGGSKYTEKVKFKFKLDTALNA